MCDRETIAALREQLARTEGELRRVRGRADLLANIVRSMRLMFRTWLSVMPEREVLIADADALKANLGDQVWWWRDVKERRTLFRLVPHAETLHPGADPFVDGLILVILDDDARRLANDDPLRTR